MRILALDSSGELASCAVYDTDEGRFLAASQILARRTHSQILGPLLSRTLDDAALAPRDLDAAAVCAGPGSYTGLRIGIALVQSFAYAATLKVQGVSTLRAMAHACIDFRGILCPVLTARKDLYYASLYRSDGQQLEECLAPGVYAKAQLLQILAAQSEPLWMLGDGEGFGYPLASAHHRYPTATGAALTALADGEWTEPAGLRPLYLQEVHFG